MIISSWREVHPLALIEEALRAAGCRGRVSGSTPVMPTAPRSAEVIAYLRSIPTPAGYVILDDAGPYVTALAAHAVRIAADVGLQDGDVDEALRILGRPWVVPEPFEGPRKPRKARGRAR